jgi:two-component system, cell cycle response regulator
VGHEERRPAKPSADGGWPEESPTGRLPTVGFRILVVDDTSIVRRAVQRILVDQGHQVFTAASGEEAFELCLTESFDLLVSDVTMEALSGVQLCRLLRSDPATADMPIILLTAADDPRSRFWGRRAGADEYIAKEAMAQALVPAVDRLLAQRPSERAERPGARRGAADPMRRLAEVLDAHLFDALIVAEMQELLDCLEDRREFARRVAGLLDEVARFGYLTLRLGGPAGPTCLVRARDGWPEEPTPEALAALGVDAERTDVDLWTEGPALAPNQPVHPGDRALFPIEARGERMGELVAFGGTRRLAADDRRTFALVSESLSVLVHSLFLMEETHRLARTDPLTGLANRRTLTERLEHELRVSQRSGQPLTVALCDVDHFKRINDSFGHNVGDAALRQIGCLLEDAVRSVDLVGRWGGEEFLVVLPGATGALGTTVAERLRAAVEASRFPNGVPDLVTVSVGVACLAGDEPAHALLERADQALYEAKEQGRNRVVCAAG